MSAGTIPRATSAGQVGTPSSAGIVGSIIAKDAVAFRRNRFLMLITFLVLVMWATIYHVLPSSVDETFPVGVVVADGALPEGAPIPAGQLETPDGAGVQVVVYPDAAALEAAVADGDEVTAGLVIPEGFAADLRTGSTPTVTLVVPAGLPPQFEALLRTAASELGFALTGAPPPVDLATSASIVGTDRVGDQVSLAEQMRPLLLVVVLLMEIFALATLVAGEVAERTAVAVLATPATAGHLIAAKMVFGTGLAFSEAVVLGLLIGALTPGAAPMILVALFLGAVVVTGLGLLAGSFGRDFMDTLVLGMMFMIPLMVPAIAALFPGAGPDWVQLMPTSGVVDVVVSASRGTLSWAEAAAPLGMLAGWGLVLATLGAFTLNRRVARL
jgi:ABC-2 type transport system permease protein